MAIENRSDTFDVGGELTVHRLGFGAMRLTGEGIVGPPDDEAAAKGVLREAVACGVDLIDTADSYGPCVSERLIGEALGPGGAYPEELVVATKGGLWRTSDGSWPPCGEPEYLQNAIYGSLDRLGVGSIDLYQLHRPDPDVPFEDSVHALAELKDEGKVEHVGLSNVSVDRLETAREIVEIATVQNSYNVGSREHDDVLGACEEYGIGFLPYFPLGGGDLDEVAAPLGEVADAHDASEEQIALAWLLHRSDVILPIPGTSSVDHLHDNVAATHVELSDDQMARLNG